MSDTRAEPRLVVDGRLANAEAVRDKVCEDIAFLSNRIALMERQNRPNRPVLDTYKRMLNSRRSVLNWLEHGRGAHSSGVESHPVHSRTGT